jgi:hypothetical protein
MSKVQNVSLQSSFGSRHRAARADGCLDTPVPHRGNNPDTRTILDGPRRDAMRTFLSRVGTGATRTRAMQCSQV